MIECQVSWRLPEQDYQPLFGCPNRATYRASWIASGTKTVFLVCRRHQEQAAQLPELWKTEVLTRRERFYLSWLRVRNFLKKIRSIRLVVDREDS